METNLRPLGARVLLKREVATKAGSIIIPQTAAKRHADLKCEILACGPACEWGLKPGQMVLIGAHCGTWIDKDGRTLLPDEGADKGLYYIVMEEDILCTVDPA